MSWEVKTIGEVCKIEKGNIGITKAIAGDYPLVVLGEERRSHNEYHFDDEAVIIPLVSSTGHGDKSMKRIHYQSGKFSVGNILCVVIPRDKSVLSAHYLYRYLDLNKETELVSRMKGMANVSLPMKSIAEVKIPIPPIEFQNEIVARLSSLEESNSSLQKEQSLQLELLRKLRQQILQDAVKGRLVPQDSNDESASVLLEHIKAEKEKLVQEKKVKKEKPLPPIKPEEIPYEIPKNWVWCRLISITNFIDYRGKTPTKVKNGVKLITAKNVKFGYFSNEPEEFISEENYSQHMTRGIPQNGDILFTTEAPLGNACLLSYSNKIALAQRIIAIQPIMIDKTYLLFSILSTSIQKQFIKKQSGATAKGIKSSRLVETLIPLPPIHEQNRIVNKIERLMNLCDGLEQRIHMNQKYTPDLLHVALKEALEPQKIE